MLHCQRAGEISAAPFCGEAAVTACLAACNERWQERQQRFRCRAGPPWWAPGLILTPELRARYEAYLPLADFCADLARLAERCLPHPSWVPLLLRARCGCACLPPGPDGPASLPDLWALLPATLAGRLAFAVEDLPALFCALADPPRFGTDAERYPVQQQELAACFTRHTRPSLRLLDLACGVGVGTFATAALAQRCGIRSVQTLGLTLEPLEAWMASRQCLPHDPPRQQRLQRLAEGVPHVRFAAADVRCLPVQGPVDVVLCNGLVGGMLLHRTPDLHRLLAECARILAPGGWLLLSNRFHDGRRARVEHFADLARELNWEVSGDWHDLALRRLPADAAFGFFASRGQ
jgi:SAM-dependent methyltransferase